MEKEQPLVGYQEQVRWMGRDVITLAEIWPRNIRAMIVGINPSETSVRAGHYFQGQGARRQMMKLVEKDLMALSGDKRYFEQAALEAGIGLADVVRRPTPSARSVPSSELNYGRTILEAKLALREVPLIIGLYAAPIRLLTRNASRPGFQNELTSWGARMFRMPGPFHEAADAAAVMDTLLTY